ncbi:A-kinase anchor protein 13-like [Brachionichthys hirsutus]|uniref:A-kinase anchor protein 13-like n=1 Tax=Brachionichthys hirsutus TaxID=412623 RepID=UPI00360442E6
MKLNPQQAPLYGQCVITVQLADEELADEEGVDYFLLFAGSTQRHLTSTLRSSHDTLYALCPAHDCCEVALVTLCSVSRGVLEAPQDPSPCLGHVVPLAEHQFNFVQDLAFDMAQFLVSTAGRADGLDGALLLDECRIPVRECERLDESLALALHHLVLPPGWSLLGRKLSSSTDPNPQETLLHFSARRGLFRVTQFLLRQSGARNALRLPNREGHTPSTIAALRGHGRLQELLTEAEADTETDRGAEAARLLSTEARLVCHLPRLNTHTLTVSVHPARVPPTLQRSVEQLLHLICHLHAKGVSVLELPFESLHTAVECCDGIDTELTCRGQRRLPDRELRYLDTATGERCVEDWSGASGSSSVVCGHSETWNTERDWSLFVSAPKTEVRPQEHGVGPPEHWACLSSNTGRDYCQMEEEEREQSFSTQGLSLCDRSDGAQNKADGESFTVGIVTPAGCSKQAADTDKGEAVIQEEQDTKGKEASEPETEDVTAGKEEATSETIDLTTASGNTEASVMGQSSSSSSSDSEMNESCQEGEDDGREDIQMGGEHRSSPSLHEDRADSEGLTDLASSPGDPSNPSLIDCDDVMEGPASAGPCILMEELHKGEPPPDVNSLEQNQETAVGDYTTERQRGVAPQTGRHSGKWTEAASVKDIAGLSGCRVEHTDPLPLAEPDDAVACQAAGDSTEDVQTDTSPEMIPGSSNGPADQDSALNHGASSDDDDDDGSFKSVGSSTTEIFHPTRDNANTGDCEFPKMDTEEVISTDMKMEDSHGSHPGDNGEHSLTDTGIPLELGTVHALTATERGEAGVDPEEQLSPDRETTDAVKDTGEDLVPGPPAEDLLSASSENRGLGETTISEPIAGIQHLVPDITCQDLSEPYPPVVGEGEVMDLGQQDDQSTDTSEERAAEDSGFRSALQPKPDGSERTGDEKPPEEGLTRSEPPADASPSHSGAADADVEDAKAKLPFPNAEASSEPPFPKETEFPKTVDAVSQSATPGG